MTREMTGHAALGRDRPGPDGSLRPGAPPPLAEAKLAPPVIRRRMVGRPRIRRALEAGSDARLTLVAAPAGYGKTTAVRAWCESRDAALAWVTLDAGDNDPVRLWTYIATAVDRIRQGLGRGALQRLRLPGGQIEAAVDELMNGLAVFGEPIVIVLDDLEAVTDTECLASIDFAVEHLPETTRLVFITRTEPAIPLARRRAGGTLAELHALELAFDVAEARQLLVDPGHLELGDEELEMLVERTEGWPAALVLAGLWLRSVEDVHEAVRAFRGDQRFVAEYLSNEVLASLDDDRRSFVLAASVLGRFTAELCDAVLDRSDSGAVLDELERSNLLIFRMGQGRWFRIHALFAEFAVARLASIERGAVSRIHLRAAEWLRSRGLLVEAIEHAAAAEEHRLVAEILVENHLALIQGGAPRTLLRWARTLPEENVLAHPRLAAAAAAAAMLVGQSGFERRRFLQLAERALAGKPEGSHPYVESVIGLVRSATMDGGVGQAVREGRRAVELAQDGAESILGGALAGYARALYFAGEVDESWSAAQRALEHPQAVPSVAAAHATLALVAVERGRKAAARTHAEKAKGLVGGIGISRSWLGAMASSALGVVLAAEGRLADADHELAAAEHFYRDELATVHHARVLVLLARISVQRGRLDEGEAKLQSARAELAELADSGRVQALADEVGQELAEAKERAGSGDLLEAPTEAEAGVLRLLATDLSTREIGERLFLSPHTVRSHTRALYRKLGVNAREEAVARATSLGLLEQSESAG
jgi:LuxR family maltose regulon positive regulatory protein